MNIIKTEFDNKEVYVIDTGLTASNDEELHTILQDAIYNLNRGCFLSNTFYLVKVNNAVLAAWINLKHFIHFYVGQYHMAFNSSKKIIEKNCLLYQWQMIDLRKQIIQDNMRLETEGFFINKVILNE